jgi:hypothetical protein
MNGLPPLEPGRQYEVTKLAVIDKNTDEAVAVTQYCFEAFMHLKNMKFNDDKYDFVEINNAEFENYTSMKVVPYKEVFAFLKRKDPFERYQEEQGVFDGI